MEPPIYTQSNTHDDSYTLPKAADEPPKFKDFSKLPFELRIKIWKDICFLPRNIGLWATMLGDRHYDYFDTGLRHKGIHSPTPRSRGDGRRIMTDFYDHLFGIFKRREQPLIIAVSAPWIQDCYDILDHQGGGTPKSVEQLGRLAQNTLIIYGTTQIQTKNGHDVTPRQDKVLPMGQYDIELIPHDHETITSKHNIFPDEKPDLDQLKDEVRKRREEIEEARIKRWKYVRDHLGFKGDCKSYGTPTEGLIELKYTALAFILANDWVPDQPTQNDT